MEKPFYEFDLSKEEILIEELEEIYTFTRDEKRYNNLIFRGFDGLDNSINNYPKNFDSIEKLKIEYNKLSNLIYNNPQHCFGQFALFGESIDWKMYPNIYNSILTKILILYGEKIIVSKISNNKFKCKKFYIGDGLLTMYKKNGRLLPHRDGISETLIANKAFKPANILLYLNKNYKKEWGGNFKVEGTEIVPEFGKLVFLNFNNNNDPEHEVTILDEDINRIALLFSIVIQNNEYEIRKIQ